jgi:hypothetical protein
MRACTSPLQEEQRARHQQLVQHLARLFAAAAAALPRVGRGARAA